ncbi:class I SAM-dependent methyltransferase [Candidatus Berkelbacteria bacterium]|nr:class I SAM-dependent methyltransferase [Candidatus Berkelbacteria bacterium]
MKLEYLTDCALCHSPALHVLDEAARIMECQVCGYVFDNPRPPFDAIVRYYSMPTQYDAWLADEQPRARLWKRRLMKLRPFISSGNLLDIGTGIGQFLNLARPYFTSVDGTEVSASARAIAQERYGLTIRPGTLETIDFGPTRFAMITLFHVLEHVPDPTDLIERCRKLLAPGGRLVIAVPNDVHNAKIALRRRRQQPIFQKITLDQDQREVHLSHFRPGVLRAFLEGKGFKIIDCSLDPFYAARGFRLMKQTLWYYGNLLAYRLFGINGYDTIWVVAQNTSPSTKA